MWCKKNTIDLEQVIFRHVMVCSECTVNVFSVVQISVKLMFTNEYLGRCLMTNKMYVSSLNKIFFLSKKQNN